MSEQLYKLNDIYETIQGEGCLTGVPMVLIRLQGCPVGCSFCDTKETWEQSPARECLALEDALGTNDRWVSCSAATIAAKARSIALGCRWALITGGEPAAQPLENLVRTLHANGFKVAIETSGTHLGHIGSGADWVCVSPKFGMAGGFEVRHEAVEVADEIKHVVGRAQDIQTLKEYLQLWKLGEATTICLQPMSESHKATALCAVECVEMGWRLSIQTHKVAQLR